MPINIRWFDDQQRIVLWEFEGAWTMDELHATFTKSHNMCLEVPQNKVIALADTTGSAGHPVPSNIFSALTSRTRSHAPNFDMAVIVTTNPIIKGFINIMKTVPAVSKKFMVTSTREAALEFIQKRQAQQTLNTG